MASALKTLADHDELPGDNRLSAAQQLTTEEFAAVERSLKRKLDLRLLCCVWVIFIMNYLDRVRVTQAKLMNPDSHGRGSTSI